MIDSAAAQSTFVGLAEQNGLTNLDDPNGGAPGGPLAPGLASAGLAVAGAPAAVWNYRGQPGTHATITVQGVSGLAVGVRDGRTSADLGSGQTDASGLATFTVRALSGELDVTVSGAGAYTVRAVDLGAVVNGTPGPDQPSCAGPTASYVLAGDGDDRTWCGPAADTLEPGAGADTSNGGAGDDIFVIREGALARGTETIDGGDGNDTALFLIDRPEGVKCRKGTATSVRLSRRALIRLRGVEQVLFDYRPCSGVAAGARVKFERLRAEGARAYALVPPKPRLSARTTRRAVTATVRVGAATLLALEVSVRSGRRTVELEPLVRDVAKKGARRYVVTLTPAARRLLDRGGVATVRATTAGVLDGPRRSATARARLR